MHREKTMGFFWLTIGVCFLWDPIVGVADFLPDIIGWLLITVGISALADLNDDIAEAQSSFRRMLWVGLARIAAELLIFVFLGNTSDKLNPYERPVWTLLLAFSFAVLELCFLLPAFRNFWRGVSALSECGGARNGLATPNRRGRSLCDRMAAVTVVFLLLHAVLTVLPELTVLTVFRREGVYNTSLYRFRDLFRGVSAVASGAVGLVFLGMWRHFFSVWKRETAWIDSLRVRYEREILPNTGLLLRRRVGTGFTFLRVGILLSANLSLLYYEFLPDWGSVLVVLCGCFVLGKLLQGSSMLVGVGLSVAVVGIPRTFLNVRYLRDYVPKASLLDPAAYERYFPVCVLASIEAALTALFVGCVLICVMRMAKRYAAGEDAISRMSAERDMQARRRRANLIMIFTMFSACAKIAEVFLQPRYGWVWLIQFALSMVVFVLFNGLLTDIAESVCCAVPPAEREAR